MLIGNVSDNSTSGSGAYEFYQNKINVVHSDTNKLEKIKENDLYRSIISYFTSLSEESDNIRCAYIIGSRAQDTSYQNQFSDLDIEVVTMDKTKLLNDTSWLDTIANQKFSYLQKPSDGMGMQVRALFHDMQIVDFVFLDLDEFDGAYKNKQFVNGVFGRGVVKIFDKDDILAPFSGLERVNTLHTFTQESLNTEYKDVLFHLVYAKNKIQQGELLTAKDTIDVSIRKSLIKMIRWQENLADPNKDLWHRSRHFEKWASENNQNTIKDASPSYQKEDMEKSLELICLHVKDLAEDISMRSGIKLDYTCDIDKYLSTHACTSNTYAREEPRNV